MTAISAAAPPVTCTTPEPARSNAPDPNSLPLSLPYDSHPYSLHSQWETVGNARPPTTTMEKMDATKVARSETAPSRIVAQMVANVNWNQTSARETEPEKESNASLGCSAQKVLPITVAG